MNFMPRYKKFINWSYILFLMRRSNKRLMAKVAPLSGHAFAAPSSRQRSGEVEENEALCAVAASALASWNLPGMQQRYCCSGRSSPRLLRKSKFV